MLGISWDKRVWGAVVQVWSVKDSKPLMSADRWDNTSRILPQNSMKIIQNLPLGFRSRFLHTSKKYCKCLVPVDAASSAFSESYLWLGRLRAIIWHVRALPGPCRDELMLQVLLTHGWMRFPICLTIAFFRNATNPTLSLAKIRRILLEYMKSGEYY